MNDWDPGGLNIRDITEFLFVLRMCITVCTVLGIYKVLRVAIKSSLGRY